tara:strand:- start:42 stop:341 length:300 start_codon:yes stop_codon:yes gene_type:complete
MKITHRQLRQLIKEELGRLNESDEKLGPSSNLGYIGAKIEKAKKQKEDYDFYGPSSMGQYMALPKGSEPPKNWKKMDPEPTARQLNYRSISRPSNYFKG